MMVEILIREEQDPSKLVDKMCPLERRKRMK